MLEKAGCGPGLFSNSAILELLNPARQARKSTWVKLSWVPPGSQVSM